VPRASLPVPVGQSVLARALEMQESMRTAPPVVTPGFAVEAPASRVAVNANGRAVSWGEMHFKLLEAIAPPSLLVDSQHDIMHLSPSAGRYLQFGGGEPSRNLLSAIHPSLRIELRAALFRVAQSAERTEVPAVPIDLDGEISMVGLTICPLESIAPGLLLVLVEAKRPDAKAGLPPPASERGADPLAHLLDRELERMKSHLRDTVEQYEASTEELKASNEELQAMNEELRSATEELETSREELQSINEELTTVNQELKSKVDELGHSNSDMQNLMDATAIATLFLDRDLCITRYTPSAVALFNLIPSDVGRPLSHLSNKLDYAMLDEDARRVLDGLVPIEREVRDAPGQWYLLRMRPYRTVDDRIAGIVLTLVDITERKDAESALRRSEERLRLVLDNAVDYAIFSMNLEGRIVSWNPGAERLLGYSEAEVLNQSSEILFTDEDRQAGVFAEQLRRALAEGRAPDDRVLRRKDGRRFWASGSITQMRDAERGVVGFVKILRDQTAARDAEEAIAAGRVHLLQALEDKEHARAELEAADIAKDRFLAVLSHELRNPLAAIAGASAVLHSGELDEGKSLAHIKRILSQQVATMRSLLDDLLDISRLRLGRFELKRRHATLSSILEAAVDAARADIERNRHKLVVSLPERPVMLNVDPTRIGQVVCNLLVNAAKYTPAEGRIELAATWEDEEVTITVVDNGRGLNQEALASLFEMFWRAPDLDSSTGPSMGIGLSLAHSIVALHGGTLQAHSDGPDRGSRFTMILPATLKGDAAEPAADGERPNPKPGEASPRQALRILIADDNEDVTWTQASVLEAHGFQVRTAADGQQAIEALADFRPDVALLDIAMGGVSGIDVAQHIRAQPWGRSVLLFAATGWGSDADRQRSLTAGFDDHLVKPINMEWLIGRLAEHTPR
jgi:two-component system, chemotaxis family, CheB/CheR fusion protein